MVFGCNPWSSTLYVQNEDKDQRGFTLLNILNYPLSSIWYLIFFVFKYFLYFVSGIFSTFLHRDRLMINKKRMNINVLLINPEKDGLSSSSILRAFRCNNLLKSLCNSKVLISLTYKTVTVCVLPRWHKLRGIPQIWLDPEFDPPNLRPTKNKVKISFCIFNLSQALPTVIYQGEIYQRQLFDASHIYNLFILYILSTHIQFRILSAWK